MQFQPPETILHPNTTKGSEIKILRSVFQMNSDPQSESWPKHGLKEKINASYTQGCNNHFSFFSPSPNQSVLAVLIRHN